MRERKLDFLFRRPVRATILVSTNSSERQIADRLPDEYLFENGQFRFPAGYWESYFVNGKEYNAEGNRSLEEQKELITKDLSADGFTSKEVDEFVAGIEIKEGRPVLLTFEASNKWLRCHPEIEKEALRFLDKIKSKIQSETEIKVGRGMKK